MNPLFPLNEYVPDGEPHVFGDRVYLYGSHDSASGERFCVNDYTVWSSPVTDLTAWTNHGILYKKSQDPRSRGNKLVDFYAPDCVRGNDGRYYLYYFAAGPFVKPFGPMSVAVSDKPEGPFEYLSDVKGQDGKPLLTYLTNDPAVINDGGRIYLYYGWGLGRDFRNKALKPLYHFVLSKLCRRPYKEIKETKPSGLSCAFVELSDDMYTAKSCPKAVLDSKTTADKRSELYNHPFYEAPSIRKFDDAYYLIYSSGVNNELCYATSNRPDGGFTYRGVLVSNSDIGYNGNKKPLAPAGTIHGSVEKIGGEYYVFYHRCTNNTDFSRQACAEKITMKKDGSFVQAEITTQGVGEPLAEGEYPAAICCNLFNDKTTNVQGNDRGESQPNITENGGECFVRAITNGTVIGYKYFDIKNLSKVSVTARNADGELEVCQTLGQTLGRIKVEPSKNWQTFSAEIPLNNGVYPLYFIYKGKGKAEFLKFSVGR